MLEQDQILSVSLDKLEIAALNVRKEIGDVTELADSIKQKGILQPLLVRPKGSKFEIVIGARRFSAAKKVGLKVVPVIVKDLSDEDTIIESLTENLQRNNLEPGELGQAITVLRDRFDLTEQRIGKMIGISQAKVADLLSSYQLLIRLEGSGKRVTYRPSADDRASKGSIPYQHVVMVQRAFDNDEVKQAMKSLSENEAETRKVKLVAAVAPMTQYEAEKILDYFKMYPEKPIQEVVSKGMAKLSGVALQTRLTPSAARKLEEFADRRGMASDEMLPELIEKGIDSFVTAKELLEKVGTEPQEPKEGAKHWSEGLDADPIPVQIGNWYRWNSKRVGKFDFYTTHYSGKDVESMIAGLKASGVKTLVDVRDTPFSQFRPEFNKERLSKALSASGIDYLHLPELGVPKPQREQLVKSGDWATFFRWYDSNAIPKLRTEMKTGRLAKATEPLAFMCVEKDPEKCHRHRIALALEKDQLRSYDL